MRGDEGKGAVQAHAFDEHQRQLASVQDLIKEGLQQKATVLQDLLGRFGVATTFVDGTDVANFEHALTERTRLIVLEPDRGAGFMNFAPRVMVHRQDVAATGLVQPAGSNIAFGPAIGKLAAQHYQDLAVVRGVNMGTLTHEVGRRYFLTGKFPRGLAASGSSPEALR